MIKNIFITLLFVFTIGALAQETSKQNFNFSLQQAIEHAIKNNYTALNASRDIEISKEKKWETTASGLPQIKGNVGYQDNIELQKSLIPAKFFDKDAPDDAFAEVAFGTKHNMGASLTLTQLLFDGSYLVGLQASKVYLEYFKNAKKKTDAEIRAMVTSSYGNVLLAEESIKILEKNQTILEKNYKDINQIYKNGLGEEESVEQLSITLASVKSNLKNVKNIREVSLNMLKINLGLDVNDDLILSENLETLSQNNLISVVDSNEFKVENNIDYQIVSSLVTQKQLMVKLEKSKALPSLGAAVNFGYNSFGQNFTFFNEDQRWFNYSNLGINLNVPIFSSLGRSARTQQAKIDLDKAKTQQTEVSQLLKLQFQKAKSDFEFSIEEYASAKNNLNLAERIEKKQQIKFKEGLSTSFEFSEAQRQLYANQQSYLQSMVDVINKRATLEKLTNKTN
jgi:outer membrane protein